jgi:DUF917 family protein
MAKALGGRALIKGRVTDLQRNAATIDGTGRDAGRQLRIELQSQFMVAFEDGAVSAAVPDLITVLAADTGAPIGTETLRRGDRVAVVTASAHDTWRTEKGLALAGPRAFGYGIDYA